MPPSGTRLAGRRDRLALWLIGLAMAMRLLVPAGWMPAATPAGGWALALCSGTGPMVMAEPIAAAMPGQMAMPGPMARPIAEAGPIAPATTTLHQRSDQKSHPGSHHQAPRSGDHPCTFSGLGMALDMPAPAILAAPRPNPAPWLAGYAIAVAPGHGLAAPPPPSTGPPDA